MSWNFIIEMKRDRRYQCTLIVLVHVTYCAKHITPRYHYVTDNIAMKQFIMNWIAKDLQLEDLGTK